MNTPIADKHYHQGSLYFPLPPRMFPPNGWPYDPCCNSSPNKCTQILPSSPSTIKSNERQSGSSNRMTSNIPVFSLNSLSPTRMLQSSGWSYYPSNNNPYFPTVAVPSRSIQNMTKYSYCDNNALTFPCFQGYNGNGWVAGRQIQDCNGSPSNNHCFAAPYSPSCCSSNTLTSPYSQGFTGTAWNGRRIQDCSDNVESAVPQASHHSPHIPSVIAVPLRGGSTLNTGYMYNQDTKVSDSLDDCSSKEWINQYSQGKDETHPGSAVVYEPYWGHDAAVEQYCTSLGMEIDDDQSIFSDIRDAQVCKYHLPCDLL